MGFDALGANTQESLTLGTGENQIQLRHLRNLAGNKLTLDEGFPKVGLFRQILARLQHQHQHLHLHC